VTQLNIIAQGTGQFIIDGDLTFSTIDQKTIQSVAFLTTAKQITIDLGRVVSTDSAGLALMIEWIKYTRLNLAVLIRLDILLRKRKRVNSLFPFLLNRHSISIPWIN
jgi:ABC-type transporter Mla MlaB component